MAGENNNNDQGESPELVDKGFVYWVVCEHCESDVHTDNPLLVDDFVRDHSCPARSKMIFCRCNFCRCSVSTNDVKTALSFIGGGHECKEVCRRKADKDDEYDDREAMEEFYDNARGDLLL